VLASLARFDRHSLPLGLVLASLARFDRHSSPLGPALAALAQFVEVARRGKRLCSLLLSTAGARLSTLAAACATPTSVPEP
jgi:hypothetical protein